MKRQSPRIIFKYMERPSFGAEKKNVHEAADRAMEEALLHSEMVGAGRDALVFRFSVNDIEKEKLAFMEEDGIHMQPDREDAALKVLKVYRPGAGVKEYQIHAKAYEAV